MGRISNISEDEGCIKASFFFLDSLKGKNSPYISLADFDLSNQEIRQELLKHIGTEYNSVLGQDITDADGAKKVDLLLGNAYRGLNLGVRTATAIFLYSFSGGQMRGATLGEIKRCATTTENPASVVAEAVEQLSPQMESYSTYRQQEINISFPINLMSAGYPDQDRKHKGKRDF